MPAIRYSCLKKLSLFTETDLSQLFPDIPIDLLERDSQDYLIKLSREEEKTIEGVLGTVSDPMMDKSMRETKKAVDELVKASFRETRNAFGAASGLFGAMTLFLTNVVTWGVIVNTILLTGPVALVGLWIYWRVKREEEQINQDIEADFYEKKIALQSKYKKITELKAELKQECIHSSSPSLLSSLQPNKKIHVIKPYKEKRHLIANPVSHFIFPALSAIGMCYSLIKIGIFGSVIIAGGPVCWGISIGAGCLAGLYFSYKRYHYLQKKIHLEKNISQLLTIEKNLDREMDYLSHHIFHTYQLNADYSESATYKNVLTKIAAFGTDMRKSAVHYIKKIMPAAVTSTFQFQPEFVQRQEAKEEKIPLLRMR